MDPKKSNAVRDWPTPSSVKDVQRFLGFANFCQWFICSFSFIVAPHMTLTKKSSSWFIWTAEAEEVFSELKRKFTSAPVLVLPNPVPPSQ